MHNILIVVDMQNDFVTGTLGSDDARAIVPLVAERIKKSKEDGDEIYFTRDIHFENYLETQEGKNLPIVHCINGTEGAELVDAIKELSAGKLIIDKSGFGSINLVGLLQGIEKFNPIDSITLIGLCTDVCIINNAMLMKAAFPEIPVIVEESLVAGVTREGHDIAIKAMRACQIIIK